MANVCVHVCVSCVVLSATARAVLSVRQKKLPFAGPHETSEANAKTKLSFSLRTLHLNIRKFSFPLLQRNYCTMTKTKRYYCDYCDTFLTNCSQTIRRTHVAGRKHRDNVRFYYERWYQENIAPNLDFNNRHDSRQQPPPIFSLPPLPINPSIPPPQLNSSLQNRPPLFLIPPPSLNHPPPSLNHPPPPLNHLPPSLSHPPPSLNHPPPPLNIPINERPPSFLLLPPPMLNMPPPPRPH